MNISKALRELGVADEYDITDGNIETTLALKKGVMISQAFLHNMFILTGKYPDIYMNHNMVCYKHVKQVSFEEQTFTDPKLLVEFIQNINFANRSVVVDYSTNLFLGKGIRSVIHNPTVKIHVIGDRRICLDIDSSVKNYRRAADYSTIFDLNPNQDPTEVKCLGGENIMRISNSITGIKGHVESTFISILNE